jgi:hypothetical protein
LDLIKKTVDIVKDIIPKEHHWKIKLLENWGQIIGNMKDKVIIEKIDGKVLFLGTFHPAWAQEFYMLSESIKRKINHFLKKDLICEIRFRIVDDRKEVGRTGVVETKKSSRLKKGPDSCHLSCKEQDILFRLGDGELQGLMKDFLVRCKISRRR